MKYFRAFRVHAKHFTFVLALSLTCGASTRSQAAAEFRPHPVDPKDWPKLAVRATHGMVATDEQLVNFLYKLGSGASMIRVLDLDLQPDAPHYHLSANIRLVASYQKSFGPAGGKKSAPVNNAATPEPVQSINVLGNAKRATNSLGNAKRPTNSTSLLNK